MAELQTVDVMGVEVLKPGTWNGRPYDSAEMDAMVDAFQELHSRGTYTPAAKLGHNKTQRLAKNSGLVDSDGHPALGTVSNLYKRGEKVYADFTGVPAKLAGLIKAGGYGPRSCEIWFNKTFDEKVYPVVLKAVSWLGADAPAVSGLDEYVAMYSDDGGDEVHVVTLAAKPAKGKFASPADKGWPLNTAKRVQSAMAYYNAGAGRSNHSASEWASIGRKIAAAANGYFGPGHSLANGKITTPSGGKNVGKRANNSAAGAAAEAELSQETIDALKTDFDGFVTKLTAATKGGDGSPQMRAFLKAAGSQLKQMRGIWANGGISDEGGAHRENVLPNTSPGEGTFGQGGYDKGGSTDGRNKKQAQSGTGYWAKGGIDQNGNTGPINMSTGAPLPGTTPTQPGVKYGGKQGGAQGARAGKGGKPNRFGRKPGVKARRGKATMSERTVLEETLASRGVDLGGERLKKSELRRLLGLPEGGAELSSKAMREILGIGDGDDVKTALLTLKARSVDLTEHNALATQVNTLMHEKAETHAHALVKAAIDDGRLAPKQREWAEAYCLSDEQGFTTYVEHAPKIVDYQTLGSDAPGQVMAPVTDMTLRVARVLEVPQESLTSDKSFEERLAEINAKKAMGLLPSSGIIHTARQAVGA